MSFVQMTQEMLGVPGMNFALAQTKINEGLGDVYDSQLWSFQLQESGWLTPGLMFPINNSGTGVSAGTITVSPFTNQITGNATASAAWLSLTGRPFLTELQIRNPFYSIYSIVAVNATNPNAVVLTIDRPWMEPALTNGTYMMYQCYFPVPVPDFKKFYAVQDPTFIQFLNFWKYKRSDLAAKDPQRTEFNIPSFVVPYQVDQRPGSATLGNMLYELWPHPLSQQPYYYAYMRRGPLLVNPTDTVPYPLTEDLVKDKAYEKLYLWKESQKGNEQDRGAGANWITLADASKKSYLEKRKEISLVDKGLVDLYWNKWRPTAGQFGEPFATMNNQLNVGGW